MFAKFFGWLVSLPIDRVLRSIDNRVDNTTERERIKADVMTEYAKVQAAILTGRGWWFPALFVIPTGIWYSAIVLYSMLWCRGCAYPQDWTIAALPPPLDEWSGIIVSSLFVGKLGQEIVSRWKR